MKSNLKTTTIIVACLALSACGGGGGGASPDISTISRTPSTTTPSTTTTTTSTNSNYRPITYTPSAPVPATPVKTYQSSLPYTVEKAIEQPFRTNSSDNHEVTASTYGSSSSPVLNVDSEGKYTTYTANSKIYKLHDGTGYTVDPYSYLLLNTSLRANNGRDGVWLMQTV